VNSIPGEAWFELDIRSASAIQLDALTGRADARHSRFGRE